MDSSLERLEDLLIQRSLEGLNDAEVREVESLLAAFPAIDAKAFDRAVSAVYLSYTRVDEPMPAALYASIEAQGEEIVAAMRQAVHGDAAADRRPVSLRKSRRDSARLTRRRPAGVVIPWLLAAASIAFAVFSWWPQLSPTPQADPLNQRAMLIEAGGRVRIWASTEDPTAAAASGDVVWDAARQEGYMRFSALAANDPDEFQYQLWIFDAERDERYPVDGGVFDIPPGTSEVVIPIRASVPVRNAVLFAITVEAPGGVVVSDRERIALVADFAQA